MPTKKWTPAREVLHRMATDHRTIKGAQVKIGIFEGQHTTDRKELQVSDGVGTEVTLRPPTNAELALWLHEGVPSHDIPARPFLSEPLSGHNPEVKDITAKAARGIVNGKVEFEQAVEMLGLWGRGRVQEKIRAKHYTPNAESTKAAKGSDTPLMDTGELASHITYRTSTGDDL